MKGKYLIFEGQSSVWKARIESALNRKRKGEAHTLIKDVKQHASCAICNQELAERLFVLRKDLVQRVQDDKFDFDVFFIKLDVLDEFLLLLKYQAIEILSVHNCSQQITVIGSTSRSSLLKKNDFS